MKTLRLTRFSDLVLKNQKVLKNRIVVPPMASSTAGLSGLVTEATLQHYANLAKSQAGLVFVEYTYVHESGKSEENQLGILSELNLFGLKKLSQTIQKSGSLSGIQITHAGGKSDSKITKGQLMGPSGIQVPVKGRELEVPLIMGSEDILLWKKSFLNAVDLAVQAGFDVIEFHSAHGYGLNQWLSPITNKRSDQYGQNLEGRSRLLFEIVSKAREKYPHALFSVRIPGQDFFEGGLSVEDSVWIAKKLEELGVDFIHVSSGIGGWKRPDSRMGEGYLVYEASVIQKNILIPVIGVGGIKTGSYIDSSLQNSLFSLAAVGRAILADPAGWYETQMGPGTECALREELREACARGPG